MSIDVTVEERNEEQQEDIFFPGNYVSNLKYIMLVTGSRRTGIYREEEMFEGAVVKTITGGVSSESEGTVRSNWGCKYFKQFHGEINIKVG